jgi:hypothetical protein
MGDFERGEAGLVLPGVEDLLHAMIHFEAVTASRLHDILVYKDVRPLRYLPGFDMAYRASRPYRTMELRRTWACVSGVM